MRELFLGDVMFLKRIVDLRDEYELTQDDMAKILGVSQSNYGRWELDDNFIPLNHLNNLCNYFKVSMDYMIGITDERNYKDVNPKLNKILIGRRLKAFRSKYNLTQTELAKLFNTSPSTLSAYETGKVRLLTAFAYAIVKKYNVSLDFLCGRIDEEPELKTSK